MFRAFRRGLGERTVRCMPVRYVDANKKHGLLHDANVRFARTRLGLALSLRFFPRIDPWLSRATGGRYPAVLGGMVPAPLMTTGAKSGQPQEVQLTYFHDGRDPILIASYCGGPKHPQWYYNLKAYPECQFGDERFVAKEVTDSDEYARLCRLAEQVYTVHTDYRVTTAAVGRHIHLFRLKAQ